MSVQACTRNPAEARAPEGVAGAVAAVRAVLGRQAHIVARLVVRGAEIVEDIHRRATAPRDEAGGRLDRIGLAGLWAKAARAVQMAVILRARLLAELRKPDSEIAADLERGAAEAGQASCGADASPEEALGAALAGRMEQATMERADSLADDRRELNRLYRHVMTAPVERLIEEIRRDLGITPDWLREVEEDWTRQETRRQSPDRPPVAAPAPAPPPRVAGPPARLTPVAAAAPPPRDRPRAGSP